MLDTDTGQEEARSLFIAALLDGRSAHRSAGSGTEPQLAATEAEEGATEAHVA